MLLQRPTLPTGYSLANLPVVKKALYSDGRSEVYSLLSTKSYETVLFLSKSVNTVLEAQQLSNWLNAQNPNILVVNRVLTIEECPANTSGFILKLHGRCLDDESENIRKER